MRALTIVAEVVLLVASVGALVSLLSWEEEPGRLAPGWGRLQRIAFWRRGR